MKIRKTLALLALCACSVRLQAATQPLSLHLLGTDWLLPFQKMSITQLYSFVDKQGYPAAETVLAGWGSRDSDGDQRKQITFGAAAVLGKSTGVPFLGFQTRLSDKLFDTQNNKLLFGVWAGHRDDVNHPKRIANEVGLKISKPIW